MTDEPETKPAHAVWFKSVEQEIAKDYKRLHATALEDPQRAGHGGEQTWARILKEWLPSSYKVQTRKYVIPEVGAKSFETDIVVLHPSYPDPLCNREEILFGGVAAAFYVRLTLDAAGVRDGVERAVALRRGMHRRFGTSREEMLAPFPVGLLAHSHDWRAPGSTPRENITGQLRTLDDRLVEHPRESLDYLCVADLGLWFTMRVPFALTRPGLIPPGTTNITAADGVALTGIGQIEPNEIFAPVASLITQLLVRLSYTDATLEPLATSLRAMGTLGKAFGHAREWNLDTVFSEIVRGQLPDQLFQQGSDFWGSAMY
ncbi:MAG: DUF6602 domain-containing protein [Ktedonobacterales bacterium]